MTKHAERLRLRHRLGATRELVALAGDRTTVQIAVRTIRESLPGLSEQLEYTLNP